MSNTAPAVCTYSRNRFSNHKFIELLETRRMLSASPVTDLTPVGRGVLSEAVSLGNFKLKSHKTVASKVGVGGSDAVYEIQITAPIDLSLTVSKLKQIDQLNLLWSDGTVITSAINKTNTPTLNFTQRLDPGNYFVDIFNGINSGVGAAKTPKAKVYHFKATGNFVFAAVAKKPDSSVAPTQPLKAPGGALEPSAGLGVEPGVDTTIVKSWVDVSADPLWGENGPSPDDIKQGQNGDCYFLAALSDIARVNPGLIEQDITKASADTYTVTFPGIAGQPVSITVDTEMPVTAGGQFAYASPGIDNAIWVPIMEKAFCFYRDPSKAPSYQAIANGWSDEVFKDFGSTDTAVFSQNSFTTGAKVVAAISTALGAGRMVALGTNQNPHTLHDLHMYSVVAINGDGTIQLRNPWGVNPPADDGGYINITGDQALVDMGGIVTATLGIVTPNNTVPVTPTPIVTPTPDPVVPVTPVTPPTYTTYTTTLQETLSTTNSFLENDGRHVDEYEVTAPADATVAVAATSDDFNVQIEVSIVNADGSTTQVAVDAHTTNATYAGVSFNVSAGSNYAIVLSPDTAGDFGAYTFYLTDGMSAPQQVTPTQPITTPTNNNNAYPTVYQETLGTDSSFTLDDGRYADVYVVNATSTGDLAIAVASSGFTPETEILQVYSDGSTSVVGKDENDSSNYYAAVGFSGTSGATYEIIVIGDGVNSAGAYTLNLSNGLTGTQQVTPSDY